MKRTLIIESAWVLSVLGITGVALTLVSHAETATHYSSVPYISIRMGEINKAIKIYSMDNKGRFPASLEELTQLTYEGKPLLEKEYLLDSWGEPFEYESNGRRYLLMSSGPDKIMGTKDDWVDGWPPERATKWAAERYPPADGQGTNRVGEATLELAKLPVAEIPPTAINEPVPPTVAVASSPLTDGTQQPDATATLPSRLWLYTAGGVLCLCSILYFLQRKSKN